MENIIQCPFANNKHQLKHGSPSEHIDSKINLLQMDSQL
jgi:hypothetical protein